MSENAENVCDLFLKNDPIFEFRALHGQRPYTNGHESARPIVAPIALSTTYKHDAPGQFKTFSYSRYGNPNRNELEDAIASLEGAKHGCTFSSGSAATTAIIQMLKAGDHVIVVQSVYSGTRAIFEELVEGKNIEINYVNGQIIQNIENVTRKSTSLIYIESPSNPLLELTDISAVATIAKKLPSCILVVDSSLSSPLFQRPLSLGADLALQSCSKYLNGHCDVIMGVVCTNNEEIAQRLHLLQRRFGSVPSPFDCYLVNRSLKTLAVRMKCHMANGMAVAKFLEGHPCVEKVLYPGLPSHPQHKIAKQQLYGVSGMLAFYIKGDDFEVTKRFSQNLQFIINGTTYAGFETIVEFPSTTDEKNRPGITDGLVRLSCGLEPSNEIIKDLDQALNTAVNSNSQI